MKAIKLYIGLDVHKDSITIAIAPAGRTSEIRLYGTITNDLHALEKALAHIRKAHPGSARPIELLIRREGNGVVRHRKPAEKSCPPRINPSAGSRGKREHDPQSQWPYSNQRQSGSIRENFQPKILKSKRQGEV